MRTPLTAVNRQLCLVGICAQLVLAAVVSQADAAPQVRDPGAAVAILADDLPGCDRAYVAKLMTGLGEAGFAVQPLSAAQVCDPQTLSPEKFFLYVIPQCRTYPAAGLDALAAFASGRGHVLFLGGPLLDDPVWSAETGWFNRAAVEAAKRSAVPQHAPLAGPALNPALWQHASSDPAAAGSWEVRPEGPQRQPCFCYWTQNLTNWDGYMSPDIPQLFGPEHTLLSMQVKGGPSTPQLVVEIQEQDGSRWMAVVDIASQWQRVALDARDFKYWIDSPTRDKRGGSGDQLQPAQARRIGFQLAFSHTSAVAPGEHRFWLADLGTCEHPVKQLAAMVPPADKTLETILPRYKVYPVDEPVTLRAGAHPCAPDVTQCPAATDLVCGIPRTMGRGFSRDQKWRFLPLVDAVAQDGRARGHAAWLLLNHAPPYAGSVFACLGVNDPAFLHTPAALALVQSLASRLRTGVFLREAGAEHFAYWPGEAIQLGADVQNLGLARQSVVLRMMVRDAEDNVVLSETTALDLPPRENHRWEKLSITAGAPGSTYRVSTALLHESTVLDQIEHEIHVLDTAAPAQDQFLTVRGNNFYLGDHPWYPVGVNFWPLYVSGMHHEDYWAGWLQRRYYDPALVEEDLERMAAIGINLVSIQSPDPKFYRNLLDFICRCRKHDIYVNLYCGLASPLAFREKELRDFLATARLADNPTIMAYDTIWEPGNYVFQGDRRAEWDEAWREWVVEQYGSLEAAEADWGVAGRRDAEGRLISPPDEHFSNDGPWRTMMAAYRRFMDDLTSSRWNRAHRRLRELDPNHLVSFRQGNTLPHDFVFTGTPKHIDFICPEGYSIPPTDDGYYAAGFITKYVHFTTGGKPIVWSEFGQSVWNAATMSPSSARIDEVSKYHEMFYRMALESGANGTIPWWWPGGYREGERSDFGIANPDGSPRPAAQLIAQYGPQLKSARQWPAATVWFDMDRDAHAGGYWYASFHSGRDAYRRAVEAGEQLGIRTAGSGTTSANTPLVAVGNRPCTGKNPPKYLNAEFNWLLVQDAEGQWTEATDGRRIAVSATGPIKARVCVGNTQEATWLAPRGAAAAVGEVSLQTTDDSALQGRWSLPADTRYLADADFGEITLADGLEQPVQVELRMAVEGRTGFGEKRTFTLHPR